MVFVKAFVIGGLICAAVQILMEKTKLMPGRIMVLLVCSGVVLGAVGLYEPILEFAGAGASVPLLGFGNVLWKGIKQAVDESGFLGLFKGGFTACAVGVEDGAVVLCVVPEELPELVLPDDEPPCAVHTFESCSSVIAYS